MMGKLTIIVAAAAALLVTAAYNDASARNGDATILKSKGPWSSYYSPGDEGNGVCGMMTIWKNSAQMLIIKYNQGHLYLHAFKPTWRLKDGTSMNVTVRFDNGPAQTISGIVDSAGDKKVPALYMGVNKDAELDFMHEVADSDRLTIGFPDGDEPDWVIDMTGTHVVGESFKDCANALIERDRRDANATQPSGRKPTQPTAPKAHAANKDDGSI